MLCASEFLATFINKQKTEQNVVLLKGFFVLNQLYVRSNSERISAHPNAKGPLRFLTQRNRRRL